MSYYLEFEPDGQIGIDPPLTYAEFKNSPFTSPGGADAPREVRFVQGRETVETDEGILERVTATALVLSYTERDYNGRDLLRHLQEAVDAYPDHTFSGRLCGRGERWGDLFRIVVRDGKAVRHNVELVWPPDSEIDQV